MSKIKDKNFTISVLVSMIPMTLIILILMSPVSLTFRLAYINASLFALFILFTNKGKKRYIKTITIVWAVFVALLTLLHALEATGRVQLPF